jgi:cytoskeletal protein RodZ
MQTILISDVQVSLPEFRKLNQEILVKKRWWIFLLPVVYTLYNIWKQEMVRPSPIVARLGLTLFALVVIAAAFWLAIRVVMQLNYKRAPTLQQPTTYTLSASGIKAVSTAQRRSLAWSSVKSVTQYGRWYQIHTADSQELLLDADRIQAPATEADLRKLLQQQGVRVA